MIRGETLKSPRYVECNLRNRCQEKRDIPKRSSTGYKCRLARFLGSKGLPESPSKIQEPALLSLPCRCSARRGPSGITLSLAAYLGEFTCPCQISRSEERRVGKECRSRWSPYH